MDNEFNLSFLSIPKPCVIYLSPGMINCSMTIGMEVGKASGGGTRCFVWEVQGATAIS